jgi:CubicO group peptidase (beta-lactamase class C family)
MSQFGNVLTKAARAPLDRLFKARIADPIGMTRWRWTENDTPTGRVLSWTGGIWTSSRELARFGHLFLNRGNWNGRQLIDASWVDQAASVQVPASVPNDTLPRSHGAGVYGFNWRVNGIKPDGQRLWPGAPPRTHRPVPALHVRAPASATQSGGWQDRARRPPRVRWPGNTQGSDRHVRAARIAAHSPDAGRSQPPGRSSPGHSRHELLRQSHPGAGSGVAPVHELDAGTRRGRGEQPGD